MSNANLLSKADVAAALSISRRGVDRLINAGRLSRVRIGKLTRIPAGDLETLIAEGRRAAEAERHG